MINNPETAEHYERTRRMRLIECGLDRDAFCELHDRQLELVGGDPDARLHPEIVAELDAILRRRRGPGREPWPAEARALWNESMEWAMIEQGERNGRAWGAAVSSSTQARFSRPGGGAHD